VRRLRIVYAIDRVCGVLRVMAIGHHRMVYEDAAAAAAELTTQADVL
jgi:hypothetical protein